MTYSSWSQGERRLTVVDCESQNTPILPKPATQRSVLVLGALAGTEHFIYRHRMSESFLFDADRVETL